MDATHADFERLDKIRNGIIAKAGGEHELLERAGFAHAAAVELDQHAVQTLRLNRPAWNVVHPTCESFRLRATRELTSLPVVCRALRSKLHGGPDLGPTRSREAWRQLSVDGRGVADAPPLPSFPLDGMPRLTVRMAARVQGFPDCWEISGRKTAAYRQIGNAFPPPVAAAVGVAIREALAGVRAKHGNAQERFALG